MKLVNKYNQFRRDCYADLECESCGYKETDEDAYDDDNFWQNVIPNRKCKECNKSTIELGVDVQPVATKYDAYEIV